jgi:hypothetical protein
LSVPRLFGGGGGPRPPMFCLVSFQVTLISCASVWWVGETKINIPFIMKPTRCTNFTNLFWHETLHVSDSSFVHHQEFVHCKSALVYVIQFCEISASSWLYYKRNLLWCKVTQKKNQYIHNKLPCCIKCKILSLYINCRHVAGVCLWCQEPVFWLRCS